MWGVYIVFYLCILIEEIIIWLYKISSKYGMSVKFMIKW